MTPGAFRPQALVMSILSGILLTSSFGWVVSPSRTNSAPKAETAMADADPGARESRIYECRRAQRECGLNELVCVEPKSICIEL